MQATDASGKGWTYSQPWDDGRVFYHCVTVAGPFMGVITMMPKALSSYGYNNLFSIAVKYCPKLLLLKASRLQEVATKNNVLIKVPY